MSKSHEPSSEIPFELQIEILMRLPVKSLMRFKSVSKLWSSFICSQYFTDRFLKVSSSRLSVYMSLEFVNRPFKKVLLSASRFPDSDLSSIEVDQDLTIPAMEGYKASQVYRGLMCLVNGKSAQIYNTSTRQLVVLPNIEVIAEDLKTKEFLYYIGHDPVHNQYKVVCTVTVYSGTSYMTEIWVLVLGGDGSSRLEDAEKNHWSSKTLVLHPSQMHILSDFRLGEQGTTRNGEVILVPRKNNIVEPQSKTLFHVFLYNLQTNFLRKVEIKDTSTSYIARYWHIIGFDDVENIMYL